MWRGTNLGMLARKYATEERQNHQPQTTSPTVVIHKGRVTVGEKILYVLLALFLFVMSVKIIANQYALYVLNQDILITENAVEEQTKVNNDLSVEVSELSRYERIWERASQLGLTLDENNVKVVRD